MKKICINCHHKYKTNRRTKIYCSHYCRQQSWWKRNTKRANQIKKVYVQSHKNQIRSSRLKFHFDLTLDQYNKILKDQKGVCKICFKTCKTGNNLVVDHNHKTDKVRGLLCNRCNITLGWIDENINILTNMIKYLQGEH